MFLKKGSPSKGLKYEGQLSLFDELPFDGLQPQFERSHGQDRAFAAVDAADVVRLERVLDDELGFPPLALLDEERHVHQGFGVADVGRRGRVGVEELHAVAVPAVQEGTGEELLDGGRVADDLEVVDVGLAGGTSHSDPFSKVGGFPCD